MSAESRTGVPRLRHITLLQLFAILTVIAAHVQVRGTHYGGMAIELYFVIAGFNMATSLERYNNVGSYTLARMRRLAPEVGVIWCVSLICVAAGLHNRGLILFLFSAPLFLQNFIEPFFGISPSVNWVFLLSLWFVAAILQLQAVLFAFRRYLIHGNMVVILGVSLTFTLLCQILTAEMLGDLHKDIDGMVADTIYRMPFSHLTAMIMGVMLRLGRLQGINRYSVIIVSTMLGAGMINMHAMHGYLPISSLGYPVGMMFNYQYLWGYPLLAVAAASVCASDGWLAATLAKLRMPAGLEKWLDSSASLGYGAYVFHGLILSAVHVGLQFYGWALGELERFVLFLLIAVGAFFSAWLFQSLRARCNFSFGSRKKDGTLKEVINR
jgi:hypothetical protein